MQNYHKQACNHVAPVATSHLIHTDIIRQISLKNNKLNISGYPGTLCALHVGWLMPYRNDLIPLKDPEASSLVSEKAKKKILIVDDEPDMGIFVSNLLDSDGFSPILAKDKAEGLKKAFEDDPAVIIIDMMMPGEGGIQMYRSLKREERFKNVPVIMLSTIDKQTFFKFHMVRGSHPGKAKPEPDIYLEKPPEAEELLRIVRELSESWAANRPVDKGQL